MIPLVMKPRFVESAVLSWNFTWMLQRASDVSYQVQEELRDPWFSIFLAVRLCTASLVALQLSSTCILPSCRVCKLSGHFWIKWCHFIVVTLCISLLSVDVAVARSAPMLTQGSKLKVPRTFRLTFVTFGCWNDWTHQGRAAQSTRREWTSSLSASRRLSFWILSQAETRLSRKGRRIVATISYVWGGRCSGRAWTAGTSPFADYTEEEWFPWGSQ